MEKVLKKVYDYELADKKILHIEKDIRGYRFCLYTEDKQVLYNGLLKSENEKSLKDLLEELFGYFNIAESEIKNIKPYKRRLKLPNTEISEIVEY